jgi:hypothetical protein
VAHVGVEAPEGAAGNDVRTLATEIRDKMEPSRPAVVAVAARSNGKASLIVAVNEAAKGRGLSASDLVKGALSGRGGGNADVAQGGGVPADQVPVLLAAVEKGVKIVAAECPKTPSPSIAERRCICGAGLLHLSPADCRAWAQANRDNGPTPPGLLHT